MKIERCGCDEAEAYRKALTMIRAWAKNRMCEPARDTYWDIYDAARAALESVEPVKGGAA